MDWKQWLATIGGCAALFSIVPLMVWGGTGSWRRALSALREYLGVIGLLALVGGGVGLLMALATLIG